MSPILSELLTEIDAFLAGREMSESKFGIECMGDKHFVRELRKGRDCQASTIDRVRQFISAHWVDAGGSASDQTTQAANG